MTALARHSTEGDMADVDKEQAMKSTSAFLRVL